VRRLFYLAVGRLATTRWWTAYHRRWYRVAPALASRGAWGPVVLITTVGRRTGGPRSAPVFGWPEGEAVVVVASNAGHDRAPAWYLNLRANPDVEVNLSGRVRRMRARDATSEERERLWPKLVRLYPGYEVYRTTTARPIPVVLLEPPAIVGR